MRDPYPIHGRRWTWRHPLSWTCRCGLDAYPCVVEQMLARQRRAAAERYSDGRLAARRWRNTERYRWSGGAR